ncbi:MAG: RNA 3'-terminal phosphate cyclase [Nitrososphaerota archaeon]
MIVVDGSIGEGGGQILRIAIGLAAALGKPIKIVNIRAGRRNPGLQHQHLTAVKAVAELCNAYVEGGYIGSTQLIFRPGKPVGGGYVFDVGTAGSVTLVLQALAPLLPLLPRRTHMELRGGTDVPWSPPIDYVRYVFIPMARRFGVDISIELVRRGHYPRGGGIVRVESGPGKLRAVEAIERGGLRTVKGVSHAVKLPSHVAERQAKSARDTLIGRGVAVPIDIAIESYTPDRDPHLGPGSGITLYAEFENSVLGADSLGEKGKPAEVVGREAAEKLLDEIGSGAALDSHMGDMVVAIACMAEGTTRYTVSKPTLHMETALRVAEMVAGCRARVSRAVGRGVLIEIEGIGAV